MGLVGLKLRAEKMGLKRKNGEKWGKMGPVGMGLGKMGENGEKWEPDFGKMGENGEKRDPIFPHFSPFFQMGLEWGSNQGLSEMGLKLVGLKAGLHPPPAPPCCAYRSLLEEYFFGRA